MARVRVPANFTQRDVTRAVKGVKAAGVPVTRVDIGKDGTISIVSDPLPLTNLRAAEDQPNEWDAV